MNYDMKKSFIKPLVIFISLNCIAISNGIAQSDSDREQAMQIAEVKTGGKSLRAKFNGSKNGYKVRVMKDNIENGKGIVIHVFIPLEDIK